MTNPPLQVLIYKLEYDEDGDVVTSDIRPADPKAPAPALNGVTAIGNHLRFDDDSRSLFMGRPWAKWTNATVADANGTPVGGVAQVVQEITLRNEGNNAPGLSVSFQNGATINISEKNWFRIGGPSTVVFDKIRYVTDGSDLEGSLII